MTSQDTRTFRLGTRGSRLALAQTARVRELLLRAHPGLSNRLEVIAISTTGDQMKNRRLSEIGGKGLFTKEIEAALLDHTIDAAVHSMKDVETIIPESLTISCILSREDPRDVLFSHNSVGIHGLPKEAIIGTSSLRRQAQMLGWRPDRRIIGFRGNVETRLKKFSDGEVDATLLALAGLRRLGLKFDGQILETTEMLPALAQGAIGIQTRSGDKQVCDLLEPLQDSDSHFCITAERAMLRALGGSCRTPIGGLAVCKKDQIRLVAKLFSTDGGKVYAVEKVGSVRDVANIGREAGEDLRQCVPPEILVALL